MFEKTLHQAGKLFEAVKAEAAEVFSNNDTAKVRTHQIVSQNGHITITGEFKSLTINGLRVYSKGQKDV